MTIALYMDEHIRTKASESEDLANLVLYLPL
ncbi:hypothetical protein Anacy_4445 [Anabaena cylindrica PCC 7122]|uniref:Uncharacterized protein n=1 Tax=Anabaena cylindrica (strain ATCC 27899 / PCC 7122) TaxID=272123 RepID=K9ZKP2_ANACC|nr:hypothetical protein Anacy_4445 [Anabaena cylindrica PCC 7122]BAY03145.1 hypothetical protein NIES19_23960 [Anabaena cylindrica PCC 7122]